MPSFRARQWLLLHLGLGLAWCAVLASRASGGSGSGPGASGPQVLMLLAFVLPLPFFRPAAPRTDPRLWSELLTAFEARGVTVSSDHPRCREPNLFGLYVRGGRTVVVCARGDRSQTLRHEGWHLVQSLCLVDRPWLDDSAIAAGLSRQDRLELQVLVETGRWRREAEARAMANQPQSAYLKTLAQVCDQRLPIQAPPLGGEAQR